ncbi:MAG: hypothetical protein FH751_00275 [Firmicutes bacterium]|nr:hypothetical protein [Bacillota bacterium]
MKKILSVLLILILAFNLSACAKDDLNSYKKAVEKTDNISKGKTDFQFNLDTRFNEENLTLEKMKYIKNIEMTSEYTFDLEKDKLIARNYFNFGGMGFDSTFYKGKKSFIKMPMLGKYIEIDDLVSEENNKFNEVSSILNDKTIKNIEKEWVNILSEDDVLQGKDTVINTPDGDVKVTHYKINVTDKQLKLYLKEIEKILLKDENFIEIINETYEIDIENIKKDLKEFKSQFTIDKFKYDAFIDIDGYIINEDIDIEIGFDNTKNIFKEMTINIKTKNWDIENKQEFNFPKLNDENTLDKENLNQGLPYMFEDILKGE